MLNIAALTGAGISKPSGIPTFEDLGDIRDKLSRDYFLANPESFYKILIDMKKLIDKANPNPAHMALAEHNIPTVTMNVDGMHKKAGTKDLIEIHGNLEHVFCKKCLNKYGLFEVSKTIYCPKCKGLLHPNVVLYGDGIPEYYIAADLIKKADELIVIGTSFSTSTASNLVGEAEMSGIKVTVINSDAEIKVPAYLGSLISQ